MKLNTNIFSVPKLSGPIFNSKANNDLDSPEKYCCSNFCQDKCNAPYVTVILAATLSTET